MCQLRTSVFLPQTSMNSVMSFSFGPQRFQGAPGPMTFRAGVSLRTRSE